MVHDETATATPTATLEIRWSRRAHWRIIALVFVIGCAYVGAGLVGLFDPWVAWFGAIIFGTVTLVGLWQAVRLSRDWIIRLGTHGVEVRDAALVPWSDLTEVRVRGTQPGWLFFLGRRWHPVVSFRPRDGVQLPALPSPTGHPARRVPVFNRRLYGTTLAVPLSSTDVGRGELVSAVQSFSDVPVDDRLQRRPRD